MLTEEVHYRPFELSECDCAYCQMGAWHTVPIQSARTLRAKKARCDPAPVQWGHNLQSRYLGSLTRPFSHFERGAMEPQVQRQIELLGLSVRTPGTRAQALVGLACDFELTLALGRVLCDGLPTLDVLHLSWAPYAQQRSYWKQHGRDNCLAILLALEQYAGSIKRRLRLVDVGVPRLREYFCQLRGYTPQSNNTSCLLDTVGLDPQYYEK